jgi:hypothetical protein
MSIFSYNVRGMRGLGAMATDQRSAIIGADIASNPQLRRALELAQEQSQVAERLAAGGDGYIGPADVPNIFADPWVMRGLGLMGGLLVGVLGASFLARRKKG